MKHPLLKKELGQHFLSNAGILRKILDRVEALSTNREVMEIGPGGGALTEVLLKNNFKVVAVEYDPQWLEFLSRKFAAEIGGGQLILLEGDATECDLKKLAAKFPKQSVVLCGNLPYNRGQEIVLRFFEQAPFIRAFVVMLQKEVADKFLPKQNRKSFGPLSVKFSFLADKLESFSVSRGSFLPPPKVESSVLSFVRRTESDLSPLHKTKAYQSFSNFLHRAFSQRRKTLNNNLGREKFLAPRLQEFGQKRAEALSPDELYNLWQDLAQAND